MHNLKSLSLLILTYLLISTRTVFAIETNTNIVELNSFKDVHKYISSDSLVLIDIDNTLLTADQTIGSDQWFEYMVKQNVKNGSDIYDAKYEALELWSAVHGSAKVRLLEPETPEVLKSIQRTTDYVYALTARPGKIHQLSNKELKSLNMDFSYNNSSKPLKLSKHGEALYRDGIISAELTGKGRTLVEFIRLSKLDITKIKKIVFIDDKLSNIEDIKNTVAKLGIEFIGLRYNAADIAVKNFSSQLADKQLAIFKQCAMVISDAVVQSIDKLDGCEQLHSLVKKIS